MHPFADEMSSSSRNRTGMRKGTRSCYECRKRKVRCIFTYHSTTCEGCTAKGRRCTEQKREMLGDVLETKDSLRERIARLESIIEASRSSNGNTSVVPLSSSEDGPSSSGEVPTKSDKAGYQTPLIAKHSPGDSPQSIDPIVTLFDNAIVCLISNSNVAKLNTQTVETA
jgi:hypothetical protein